MNYSKLNKKEILLQAGVRINNSLNDDAVKNAVALMGYSAEKLQEGLQILMQAEELYEIQLKEYGDVDEAQNSFATLKAKAQTNYMTLLSIARVAFKKDIKAITTLELTGERANTISGWIKQTRNFYHAILANEAWKNSMSQYGQTEEKINAGLQELEAVNTANEQVKKEQGDAQNATLLRDEKFEELIEWLSDYDTILKIALAEQPQLIEKTGIVVKR